MKKILLFVALFTSVSMAKAQTDCAGFFPDTEGSVLESTTYNASNQPLRKMIYRVNKSSGSLSGSSMEVGFTMMRNNETVLDSGIIDANCMNGNFSMKMRSRALTPEVMQILSTSTELVGNFLDYPNIFNNDFTPFANSFNMSGGEFTIESNNDNHDNIRVRVYNRQYEGNERIHVPARRDSFDAAKVTFGFEVTQDGVTKKYKGKEWYSNSYGIIRSETYDDNDNLINTTLLTSMRIM